jgi:hypothetical protein
MADTAKSAPIPKGVTPASASGRFMVVARKIKKMSTSEFLNSLRRAGIITGKNTLKAKYKKK